MCWKTTMNLYNSHGLPYMVMEYLKIKGVNSAGCFDIARGSHNITFYANKEQMDIILKTKDHRTGSHTLWFMADSGFQGKYHCNCVKIKE